MIPVTQWRAALGLLVALPLVAFATYRSTLWIGSIFPGFLLMENGVIASVGGYDWPPDKGVLFHAQVTAVDGQAVRTSGEVYGRVAARPAGTTFRYALRKGGERSEVVVVSRVFSLADYAQVYGILLLIGLSNLGTAIAVVALQPATRPARVYFWTTFIGGLFATLSVFLHQAGFTLLGRCYFLAETFFPAAFVHLGMVFPVDRLSVGPRRWWAVVPYAIATVLAIAKLRGFYADPPDLTALHATYLFIAAAFVFFVASALQAFLVHRDPLVRLRLRVVLVGIVAGSCVSFAVFIDNALHGGHIPMQLGVALVPIFFLTVAYAIAKHDLFDVDRIVRQSFVYGTLSAIVVGTYALVLLAPARLVPELAASIRAPLGIAFVLLLALALEPLRRAVQDVVDRAFYRTRLSYRRTIDGLSETLTTLLEVSEVVAQVTRVVTEAMQLESTSIALVPGTDERAVVWTRDAEGRLIRRPGGPGLAALGRTLIRHPRGTATRREDPRLEPETRATLERWGASLALPLAIKGQVIGLLLLGGRRSGRSFDGEDVALLRTLAHQAAIALHNAHSYEGLASLTRELDLRVREQTDELRASNDRLSQAYHDLERAQTQLVHSEKMTSLGQLVAGVAHELNNPASFVHGSLQNLAEYLETFIDVIRSYERLATEDPGMRVVRDQLHAQHRLDYLLREAPQLLRICAEGSERIRNIVADLRTFARVGGSHRIAISVPDGIESTLRLLEHRLSAGHVGVVREYQEVPPVQASPGELNQAWMNLLSNAVDAVMGRAQPEIRVGVREVRAGDGRDWIEVEIRDNGAGISPDHLPHIFEPFFTTKAIGQGTGLGLSIAYGAVKSHGGEIAVTSIPDRGTTFVVRLPVVDPKRGARTAA